MCVINRDCKSFRSINRRTREKVFGEGACALHSRPLDLHARVIETCSAAHFVNMLRT